MVENRNILEEWVKIISKYEKIPFKSIKDIYMDIKNNNDAISKKINRKKLIEGTLYIVSDFITSNKLWFIKSKRFDMNDIIAIGNEAWIEIIDSEMILNINSKNKLDYLLYSKLLKKLDIDNLEIGENTILNVKNFHHVIAKYIEKKKEMIDINYNSFLKFIYEDIGYCPSYGDEYVLYQTYELIESIVKIIEDDNGNTYINKTQIAKYKYVLLEIVLEYLDDNIEDIIIKDPSEEIIDKLNYIEFRNLLEKCEGINDRGKDIIFNMYGLYDGKRKSEVELSQIYGLSKARIHQIVVKIFRELRYPSRSSKIKQYL